MPILKPLNLARIWVKQNDLDKTTRLWRVKCAVNFSRERQRLEVFNLQEPHFLRFSTGKGLQGCYSNLV